MKLENNIQTSSSNHRGRGKPSIKWFLILTTSAAIFTFILIIVGGLVRVSGSGLGCPDWPLCHGKLVPPLEFTALMEYSHRMMAVLTSLLIVVLGIFTMIRFRSYRSLIVLGLLPVIVMIIQVSLGGITVLMELSPTVVTIHMAVAAIMLGILIVGAVSVGDEVFDNKRTGSGPIDQHWLWYLALFTAVAVYILGILGSYVSGSGASSACLTWPLCHGDILPSGKLFMIHMVHRFAVGIVAMAIVALVVKCWKYRTVHMWISPVSVLLAALFLVQVLTGAAMVWSSLLPIFRSLHLTVGMATWGAAVALVTLVRPKHLLTGLPSVVTVNYKETTQ